MPEKDPNPAGDETYREGEPFRVLFVCTGNTCRSPLSEALARRALERRGWKGVEVRSAGIAAFPGGRASEGAIRAAERNGLDLGQHVTHPVTAELVAWADLILTMSPGHLEGVVAAGGGDRVSVITAFAHGREGGAPFDDPGGYVPDPYGGSDPEYEATYRELERLVERVLDRLAPVLAP
jgi:protein-tyrosine phosphatase